MSSLNQFLALFYSMDGALSYFFILIELLIQKRVGASKGQREKGPPHWQSFDGWHATNAWIESVGQQIESNSCNDINNDICGQILESFYEFAACCGWQYIWILVYDQRKVFYCDGAGVFECIDVNARMLECFYSFGLSNFPDFGFYCVHKLIKKICK